MTFSPLFFLSPPPKKSEMAADELFSPFSLPPRPKKLGMAADDFSFYFLSPLTKSNQEWLRMIFFLIFTLSPPLEKNQGWLRMNLNHPYPSPDQKEVLAAGNPPSPRPAIRTAICQVHKSRHHGHCDAVNICLYLMIMGKEPFKMCYIQGGKSPTKYAMYNILHFSVLFCRVSQCVGFRFEGSTASAIYYRLSTPKR